MAVQLVGNPVPCDPFGAMQGQRFPSYDNESGSNTPATLSVGGIARSGTSDCASRQVSVPSLPASSPCAGVAEGDSGTMDKHGISC